MKYRNEKNFLDISELSKELDLINKKTGKPANHTLRFWEKEFKGIKPTLLKGNRRYYDKNQIDKIKYIKYLFIILIKKIFFYSFRLFFTRCFLCISNIESILNSFVY